MKRSVSILLSVLLLLTCVYTGSPEAQAATKVDEPRTIAIVFDNSNSMYSANNKGGKVEWCRATYAMEVFASMLNQNDTLLIYPMWGIQIGDAEGAEQYTMEKPLRLTGPGQSETIRKIVTEHPSETPIESIDCAIQGLKAEKGSKKYLIVLTDGSEFDENGVKLGEGDGTRAALDMRFQKNAGKDMTIMYLGIGASACEPATKNSDYFMKKMARNSAMVLSSLTDMCNLIFGRDTLPDSHKPNDGKTLNLDVSISKLIVFAQGKDISNLTLTNKATNQQLKASSTKPTKYSEKGNMRDGYEGGNAAGNTPDTSLQGLLATFTNVPKGEYTVSYSGGGGSNDSIEVYYEPNVDMKVLFTDGDGNVVTDHTELYEGTYAVQFGMVDSITNEPTTSDLLGTVKYRGQYVVNGESYPITGEGQSGAQTVTLKEGDTFDAELTVTYLSGYTITRRSIDFGWPEGGFEIQPYPPGKLRLEITGGNSGGVYPLQTLEDGAAYIVKAFYEEVQLTGEELAKVSLSWDDASSNAKVDLVQDGDQFVLKLSHKDPTAPQNTICGECSVFLKAKYRAAASEESETRESFTYNITEDRSVLEMSMNVPEDYIVISDLPDSKEITVALTINGQPLTAEQFQNTIVKVDCGGIQYTVTPCPEDSTYKIKLQETDGIEEDDYIIKVSAEYTDLIGRVSKVGDESEITLSTMPLWLKWAIFLLILLILIIIILIVMHIKVLPKYAHITKKGSTMNYDGEDRTKDTQFDAKMAKGNMTVRTKYAGTWAGVVMDVKPGKESYLKKRQIQRTAEVKSASVRKTGTAVINEVTIGTIKYVLNEDNNKLERKQKKDTPFELRHGMPVKYSGTIMSGGTPTPFTVSTKLNFKKK